MTDWLQRNGATLAWLAVVGALAAGIAYFLAMPRTPPVRIIPPTPRPTVSSRIVVHVTGAVAQPGLYSLEGGTRVADAIRAAGGATAEADLDRLNLAAHVVDGQRVLVPARAQVAEAVGSPEGGKVNLNTASAALLDTIPGVGPVTAAKIIEFRTKNGPFNSVEQLRDAGLVGSKLYEKMKDLVTVE